MKKRRPSNNKILENRGLANETVDNIKVLKNDKEKISVERELAYSLFILIILLTIFIRIILPIAQKYKTIRYSKICMIVGLEMDFTKSFIFKEETEPSFKEIAKWKTTCFVGTPKEKDTKKIEVELEEEYELDNLEKEVLQKEQELREKEEEKKL